MRLAGSLWTTVWVILLGFASAASATEPDVPEGTTPLSHVDDTAEGKRSLGGSGHAVLFERPGNARFVEAVEIFGGRYGHPEPPDEDFHLYLLNDKRQILADVLCQYGTIERGELRWYALRTPSIEVPEAFYVALSFNPQQTKGIFLGLDKDVRKTHSFIGLPDHGFDEVDEYYEWMVRVHLAEKPSGEKGIQRLADWKPPKPAGPFADCIEAKYDTGESEGQQSYGGSGPAIKVNLIDFVKDAAADGLKFKGFRLYASRYGTKYSPARTFVDVSLLYPDGKLIWKGRLPYSKAGYKPKWIEFELPKAVTLGDWRAHGGTVTLAFDPTATQYKGIYFHYNKEPKTSHSLAGTVENGFKPVGDREWMIRVYFKAE